MADFNSKGLDNGQVVGQHMAMENINIAEFKNQLSRILSQVAKGESFNICKRNIPVARLVSIPSRKRKNYTQLGCGRGSVKITGDLTDPLIPPDDWDMLRP